MTATPASTSEVERPTVKLAWWFQPVPIDSLVAFRMFFGFVAGVDCFWFLYYGWIPDTFLNPPMLFKFYGFGWVHPWPGVGMYLHLAALMILAACISLGFFYRVATILFALGFTYVFLLEKAIYLNHMYLICLLSGLLAAIPCHRARSLDVRRKPRLFSATIPRWCLWLVRFQVGLPYVYGGFTKLGRDWLSGDAMFMLLVDDGAYPVIGSAITSDIAILLFTYGGLLFDLCIVPLLLWPRTRFLAFTCAVAFHLMNSQMFDIGLFPWLMIGATTIFLPPDWPRRFLQVPVPWPAPAAIGRLSPGQARTLALLALYVAFQLLFPLRQYLYPGDPNWTDEGQTFSWRMMTRTKLTRIEVTAVDPVTGRRGPMPPDKFLNPRQVRNLQRSPDLMVQFSHFLAREHRRLGGGPLQVYWRANCSLNGRKPQLLIDPDVDLAAQPRTWRSAKWILPLTEPSMSDEIRQRRSAKQSPPPA